MEELSLTANQLKKDMKSLEWKLDPEIIEDSFLPLRGKTFEPGTTSVELGPMEIRTFALKLGQEMP